MPQSVCSSRPQSRDTGFPESFGHRTTNLPHPDADTSPNACISQEDISPQRVLSRQRRSFLAKNKRTISHGMITPEMEQMYSDTAVASDSEPPSPKSGRKISMGSTKDDSNSLTRTTSTLSSDEGDGAPKPARTRVSSNTSSSRRRSFFHKLGIHRHHRQHE